MKNLEIGLMARSANPDCTLVLRVYSQRFSDSITRLLPYAKVLGAYALAAEAFAAAAFGETIVSLFRLDNQTVLVTEYRVAAQDGLTGLLLAEVAYGYGVIPLLHQRSPREIPQLLPSDDLRLNSGDRLVVLASIDSLQAIERGDRLPATWRVRIERVASAAAAFDGAGTIARISGCDIGIARTTMNLIPSTLPVSLYKHQAQRLVRELSKAQVRASIQAAQP
ncbi:MAG: hypothetical protein HC895_17560 [Leptolyngbyaceae cyanobacterium SM1_3_5]|nr:hypothetical protein [Leptolyngbyaceae cyanobacterium SM1_3_5]